MGIKSANKTYRKPLLRNPGRKAISKKQIQANRTNSTKSSGPRSPEGKLAASRNALKHGLFASDQTMVASKLGESAENFAKLKASILNEAQPIGSIENYFAENVIANIWKKKRLFAYENKLIDAEIHRKKCEFVEEYYAHKNNVDITFRRLNLKFISYTDTISNTEILDQIGIIRRLQDNKLVELADEIIDRCIARAVVLAENPEDSDEFVIVNALNEATNVQQHYDEIKNSMDSESISNLKDIFIKVELRVLREMREVRKFKREFEFIESVAGVPDQGNLDRIIKYDRHIDKSVIQNLSALASWKERNKK